MPDLRETELLIAFVRESNRIEGIARTTAAQIEAHRRFLDGPIHIPALVELVGVLQPDARSRNAVNIPGVRVGDHIAPPSGPDVEGNLRSILAMRNPWEQHVAYETLHPFTDGNGRSGRAIWLHRHWHEEATDAWAIRRGFLHSFYYHTLGNVRPIPPIASEDEVEKDARGEATMPNGDKLKRDGSFWTVTDSNGRVATNEEGWELVERYGLDALIVADRAALSASRDGEVLAAVKAVVEATPELNMGNFDVDQVAELNNAMIEIWQIIDASLSDSRKAPHG